MKKSRSRSPTGRNRTFSGFSTSLQSAFPMMMSSMERTDPVPVTNGMTHEQLYNQSLRRPRNLAQKGAQLSNNYGQIPGLRKPDKKRRKRPYTMMRNPLFM